MNVPDSALLDGEQLLQALQQYCIQQGASDIHISPEKDTVRIEIRLKGMLDTLQPITHATYDQCVRRIKFLAHLKLNVTNVPQDGQYTFNVTEAIDGGGEQSRTAEGREQSRTAEGREQSRTTQGGERSRTVNVRVATLPSRFGETVTLRLLDPKRGIIPLRALGFPGDMQQELERIVQMPYGLVLVTGPTGSGKTTTLYSLLSTLIGTKRNIITLEDPVEYEIGGIVQSEIDPDHGFTFASGLRSVLRHDPNVILVGEIRDLETAQTAVDASLTGHLVLATLHTNNAIEAIPRLLSMGVSPYTFAPALRAILAQRLIRTLSEASVASGTYDPSDPASYGGRCVLPELITVSPALRDMILAQESEQRMEEQARTDGYLPMKDWGDMLVEQKFTSKEEIERVTT